MPEVEPFQRKYVIDHSQARQALEAIRKREAALTEESVKGSARQRDARGRFVKDSVDGYDRMGKAGEQSARRVGNAYQRMTSDIKDRLDRAFDPANLKQRFLSAFDPVSTALDIGRRLRVFAQQSIQASIDFQSAFTGVRKTVDATEEQFAHLERRIRQMSMTIPVTAEEIAAVMEIAGQLGVSVQDLEAFTDTVLRLGVTTNLSSEQAAVSLARFMEIMGTARNRVGNLGSTVVALGNSFATTEAEIVDMSMRLAGAGRTVGLVEDEVFALAAAMTSVGIQSEMGGTAASQVLLEMQKASVGLSDSIDMLERAVPGFAKRFTEDAAGAFLDFLYALNQMDDAEALQSLDELGLRGSRVTDVLLRLSASAGNVERAMDMGSTAIQSQNALLQESEQRFADTASKQQLFNNAVAEFQRVYGDRAKPQYEGFLGISAEIIKAFTEMTSAANGWLEAISMASPAAGLMTYNLAILKGLQRSIMGTNEESKAAVDPSIFWGGATLLPDLVPPEQSRNAALEQVQQTLEERIKALEKERDMLVATGTVTDRLLAVNRELFELEQKRKALREAGIVDEKDLEQAQKTLEAITEASQLAATLTKDQKAALQEVFWIKEQIAKLDEVSALLPKDAYEEQRQVLDERLKKAQAQLEKETAIAEAIKRATTEVNALAARPLKGFGLLGIDNEDAIARVTSALQDYERTITGLQNQKSLGEITDKEFIEESAEATQAFMERLRSLYESMEKLGMISEPVRKAFRAAFDAGEKATEQNDKALKTYNRTLGDTANALRALEGLLNVFGDLDETISSLIRGTADVLSNIQSMADAKRQFDAGTLTESGLQGAQVLGAIGIAAGVASAIVPLVKALGSNDEELREVRRALRENARVIREQMASAFEGGRVGGDLSEDDINQAVGILKGLTSSQLGSDMSIGELSTFIRDQLEALETLGIPGLENILEVFQNLWSERFHEMDPREASRAVGDPAFWRDLLQELFSGDEFGDIFGFLDDLKDGLGDFTNDVEGAVDRIRFFTDFLGIEGTEALRTFIDFLLSNVDGLPESLRKALAEAASLDLTTEEGRNRLNAIIQAIASSIADGTFDFGGLSPEDAERILDTLKSLLDGSSSTSAADGIESSSSVRHVRQITEVQGSILLDLLREANHWLRTIAVAVAQGSSLPLPAGLGYRDPSDYIPASSLPETVPSGTYNFAIGPLNLSADLNLSEEQIQMMVRRFSEEFELQIRTLNKTAFRTHG